MIVLGAICSAAILFAAAGPDLACDQTDRAPVNVLRVGDDGLTNRLGEAIEKAFDACSGFKVAQFDVSRWSLAVTILHNVTWKMVNGRTKVFFGVEYVVRQKEHTTLSGSCWEDQLTDCAAQIVHAAPSLNMA